LMELPFNLFHSILSEICGDFLVCMAVSPQELYRLQAPVLINWRTAEFITFKKLSNIWARAVSVSTKSSAFWSLLIYATDLSSTWTRNPLVFRFKQAHPRDLPDFRSGCTMASTAGLGHPFLSPGPGRHTDPTRNIGRPPPKFPLRQVHTDLSHGECCPSRDIRTRRRRGYAQSPSQTPGHVPDPGA
jgi:hypothetical protein